MQRRFMKPAISLAVAAFLAASAGAKTVYVNRGAPGNVHDGASWGTAFLKISDALSAQSTENGDEIWVASNTYSENVVIGKSVALYGGFSGSESERNQRDVQNQVTLISATSDTATVLKCQAPGVIVDGFTIAFGYYGVQLLEPAEMRNNTIRNNYWGMYIRSEVTLTGNAVTQNSTVGVFLIQALVRMSGNTVTHNGENGIYVWMSDLTASGDTIANNGHNGVYLSAGQATIQKSTLASNSRRGIEVESGTLTVRESVLSSSLQDGIRVRAGAATLRDSEFANNGGEGCLITGGSALLDRNSIHDNAGQGVRVESSVVIMTRNTIRANGWNGVFVVSGTVDIARGHIAGNNLQGVGVYGGKVSIRSNLITGNRDDGVYVPGGHADLTSNTIVANKSEGVVVSATASMTNNIIAGNEGTGVIRDVSATIDPFSHNNVWGNVPSDYANFTPPGGQGVLSVNPEFVDSTRGDWRLKAGSPCVDTGNNSVVTPGETDQDGRPRLVGPRVDIGAYEFPGLFTLEDVRRAMLIADGQAEATPADASRLGIVDPLTSGIDLRDAARLARKAAGVEPNP